MTVSQSRISPFGKVCCGRRCSSINNGVRHQRAKIFKLKRDSQNGFSFLISLKARQHHQAPAKKKKKKKSHSVWIRRAEWYNQAEAAWAARGVDSLFHDRGKHKASEEERKNTKTTDSLACMFPQVFAKCLRRQSSVSTTVCVCFCLVMGIFFSGNWKCDFLLLFVWTKKANEGSCPWWWNRGCQGRLQHVLSLQRMAGGLSAHRKPLFLNTLKGGNNFTAVAQSSCYRILSIYLALSSFFPNHLIDVAGWCACETRGVQSWSSRSTLQIIYWTIWWH